MGRNGNPDWRMPAEWEPHSRTWMAWPCHRALLDSLGAERAFRGWAAVANAIAGFEPVAMVIPKGQAETARAYLLEDITLYEAALGDSWMRDFGPTFVLDESGALGAVDWTFNGWGGRTFPEGAADALIGAFVAEESGAMRIPSKLVNEGGGIHTDGEGTVLLTESVQLNPNRNPSWSRVDIETEVHARLGTEKAIWLKGGLHADAGFWGTDGHVDTLAAFVKPGVIVAHHQPDPNHPDYHATRDNIAILESETDAHGRSLEVIPVTAPQERFCDGEPLACSYINFYYANGAVILCAFGDPQDAVTIGVFAELHPDRKIVSVPATVIFEGGGGVHCITQQEPVSARKEA